jgi:hypothetical protein
MKPFLPDILCLAIALVLLASERWADKRGFGKIVGGVWKVLVVFTLIHIVYRLFFS